MHLEGLSVGKLDAKNRGNRARFEFVRVRDCRKNVNFENFRP